MGFRPRAALIVVLSFLLIACADDTSSQPSQDAGGAGGDGGTGGAPAVDCPPGDKLGTSAGADSRFTVGGIEYNVRVPADYDATRAHALIVVYSPHVTNDSAADLEVFTGLGPDATARGYIAAFAAWFDPVPVENRADADTIRSDVAATWCVDPARVYFTGHSDGGSISTLLALGGAPVAAIAPSAAGIDASDGMFLGCASAVPAMVIHSQDDMIFPVPSFGVGSADHFASCFQCGALGAPLADGCAPYNGCDAGTEVQYCEMSGNHYDWYGLNQSILDFFDGHVLTLP
jgi:polyhydroxybutyrate depolymerase